MGPETGMRTPQQARSQHSTDRMLAGALAVLERSGLSGLTMAAVAAEAAVSIGAIYHRFADRRQLLIAAQDRFLSQLENDWETGSAAIWGIEDRDALLRRLVVAFTETFAGHRHAFKAFIVTGNDDPELRSRGIQSSRRFAASFAHRLTDRFGCTSQAALAAYRLLFADATLATMFTADEVTGPATPIARSAQLGTAIGAILMSPAETNNSTGR